MERGRHMRILLAVIFGLALSWSAYWVIGARSLNSATADWFATRQAEGWVAETSDVHVKGFPNRFDLTFDDLTLADPNTGLAWSAPFFQILALSYSRAQVIAFWPPEQRLSTPAGGLTIYNEDMRASAKVRINDNYALDTTRLTIDKARLRTDDGEQITLDSVMLATRPTIATAHAYDVFFDAQNLRPGDRLRLSVDPNGTLPDAFDLAKVDMAVTFDAPWDRAAVEVRRPQPTAIQLRLAEARWGRLLLAVAGDLTFDAAGLPSGEITIKARNWREILGLGVASGVLGEGVAQILEGVLAELAKASGTETTLDLPLTLDQGQVRFGFIPLTQLGPLRIP